MLDYLRRKLGIYKDGKMLVQTNKGLIDRDLLHVKDVAEDHENARVIATEWFLDGELVRRDVNVSILRSVTLEDEQGKF